jgi:hypothetical protein
VHYRMWFEDRDERLPLHISARSDLTLGAWEREQSTPEDWALGLPVELVYVWLWVGDPRLREALGEQPVLRKPGAEPEVEDMVNAFLKLRSAAAAGDPLGVRLGAQDVGRFACRCVAAINKPYPVRDPRTALDTVLSLPVVPAGWGDDVIACLGLASRTVREVIASSERLVVGVLRLLRDTDPYIDPQPEVARYLLDGTFERVITHDETP